MSKGVKMKIKKTRKSLKKKKQQHEIIPVDKTSIIKENLKQKIQLKA